MGTGYYELRLARFSTKLKFQDRAECGKIEILVKILDIIDKKLETLQQHEDEILKKRVFDEKISELENMVAEEVARIWDFVKRVNAIEARLDTH